MHALGTSAKFTYGLWTSQHQDAEDGQFTATQIHRIAEAVAVFLHAVTSSADFGREAPVAKGVEGLGNGRLVECGDGLPAGLLIARVLQRVHSQRVVFGRGEVLLEQCAQDSDLNRVECFHLRLVAFVFAFAARRLRGGRRTASAAEW